MIHAIYGSTYKDLVLYEYFVKIDDKFVDITKDLIKYNSEKLKEINKLEQENQQLKEQLENKIDLYEDTISYQLGFDKGKEYMQQKIDKAIEYISDYEDYCNEKECYCTPKYFETLLEILGGDDNDM